MLRTKEGTKVNYWDYVRCEISGSHGGENIKMTTLSDTVL
jgi:hypothetical protein